MITAGDIIRLHGDHFFTNIIVQDYDSYNHEESYFEWIVKEQFDWYTGQEDVRLNMPAFLEKLEVAGFDFIHIDGEDYLFVRVKTPWSGFDFSK